MQAGNRPSPGNIQAVCFDVGGTLRATIKNVKNDLTYLQVLQKFLGDCDDPLAFFEKLRQREKNYRRWCKRTLIELAEADMWTKYMLPDYPLDFVREHAVELNQMWRASRNNRILPDAVDTIRALAGRGYPLSIVSNTTSSVEAPRLLAENDLSGYFSRVILSCTFGRRKPHPSLFLAAANAMGIEPQYCAYVGDDLSRDLVGARQAGFGEVVIIDVQGYESDDYDPDDDFQPDTITEMKPDHRIGKLGELLEIYPERKQVVVSPGAPSQPKHLYEIALSSMWVAEQKENLNETFSSARKLGFARFELTNKVTPALYQTLDTNRFYIATVHDPCPSDAGYVELRQKDISLASLDEKPRRTSVDALKRSIDLACRLGSKSVVIHCGAVQACDRSYDLRLRKMVKQGLRDTPEYQTLREAFIAARAAVAAPYVQSACSSLEEIIAFARGSGVNLALENRNRYHDLPLPDDLTLFLSLCSESWFGFQYDLGHAYTMDKMGLVAHETWIQRFKSRMIGVHLHDVKGIVDHLAPGMGDIDFGKVAPNIAETALRTLEIAPDASLEQIACGLEILVESGCIQKI